MNQEERRTQVERLNDHQIIEHARRLASAEWEAQLELFFHLAEIERRRLHLGQGHSSVFDYLVRGLGYSTSSAHRRLATARAIRDFPRVYDGLVTRQLNMSTIALLQPVLAPENQEALVGAALGKSQREVETLVARFRPAGSVRDRIVPIRIAAESPETPREGAGAVSSPEAAPLTPTAPDSCPSAEKEEAGLTGTGPTTPGTEGNGGAEARQRPPTSAAEVRSKVVFSASAGFATKVEKARALLSGKLGPGAGLGEVMEMLVDEFLERESPERRIERREKRLERACATPDKERNGKGGDGKARRRAPASAASRYIPAELRDRVYARDGGRCTYVGPDGVRCSATRGLHIHHEEPFGLGGATSFENLRLACGPHNLRMAEDCYGAMAIEAARRRRFGGKGTRSRERD